MRDHLNSQEEGGILPSEEIAKLLTEKQVTSRNAVFKKQIQPASLDLRLSNQAFRVRASFLPGKKHRVEERLETLALHRISLEDGAVLEVGCVYIVPLQEALALPLGISACANPKSSTGRLDVFTRVIVDYADAFDLIPENYQGPLYLEISPRTFPIVVHQGSTLTQIRFRKHIAPLSDHAIRRLHDEDPLIADGFLNITDNGLGLSVDLKGDEKGLVGYRALRHCDVIDVDKINTYRMEDFWEPLHNTGRLILDPGQFYILASREALRIPPSYAAEMVPFNPTVGEFRVHYAGFFDPGFGYSKGFGGEGARAVLEVRSHEVPFILEDGQMIGRLIYEKLLFEPSCVYGGRAGSHYQGQRLKLSKHFIP